MTKPRKMPCYERDTDGSPFDWVLAKAGELRQLERLEAEAIREEWKRQDRARMKRAEREGRS